MNDKYINAFITNAIQEDVGDGDHTSMACIPESAKGSAQLIVKQDGILAGVDISQRIFAKIDASLQTQYLRKDGAKIRIDDLVFIVSGKTQSILKAERLALNVMQRMSGIATQTSKYVEEIKGLHTQILDTRKTTPGVRFLEKEAVRLGGGTNHRMGLYDMVMIKDNHIDFAGGIKQAISKTNDYLERTSKNLKIIIEARSMNEIKDILAIGNIHRILIDNFTPEQTKEAVKLIARKFETESSGNITLRNVRSYAECEVDYISIGALTHQIKSLDLSLKAI